MDIVVGGAGQDQVVQAAQAAQAAQVAKGTQVITIFIIAARGEKIWTYRQQKLTANE